ncbi:MAG: transcriptional repressor [Candidatus Rokuibacteriota bacterium]|nr:MAG: transcriptional repressor [Candidatus Rokubacteria bacterium]
MVDLLMRIIPEKLPPDIEALRGHGLRNTRARRIVLETVRATDVHPTAEWVFRHVRRRLPRVSLGTVYRNLRLLVREGLLVERADAAGDRFDGNLSEHHHFTCVECGRVFDLREPVRRTVHLRLSSRTGFEVLRHRIEFYGRCATCSSPRKRRRTWQARA